MLGIVECTSGDKYIALECAQRGDLFTLIKKNEVQPKQLLRILHEICLGMHYLHKHK